MGINNSTDLDVFRVVDCHFGFNQRTLH